MKPILTLALIALVFSACGQKQEAENADAGKVMTVSQLMENPAQYIDKEVTLDGTVTHVCKHGGRRIHLTDLEPNVTVRIEAPENMAAFARELEGSDVTVSAVLRETRIDAAYLDEWEAEVKAAEAEAAKEAPPVKEKSKGELKGDAKAKADGIHVESAEVEQANGGHVEPQGMDAINKLREELKASDKSYVSQWYMEAVSYKMNDGSKIPVAKDEPVEAAE
ncbi:MAG: hypothetical protein WBQ23_14340 [Bacteroidota bacterium]